MHAYPDTVGAGRTGEMSKAAPILARLFKRPASRMPEQGIFGRGQNAPLRGHWANTFVDELLARLSNGNKPIEREEVA